MFGVIIANLAKKYATRSFTLTRPITPEEVTLAIGKLNTGRASGHDDIPAEFLKGILQPTG